MPSKSKNDITNDVENMNLLGGKIDLNDFFGGGDMWADYDDSRTGGNRTFEPLPEGLYDATVIAVEGPIQNKNKTAFMLKVQYRIDSPERDYNNRRVFQYLSLQPQSKFNLLNTFAALGKVPGDSSYTEGEFDGMPCKVYLTVRPATEQYAASNNVKYVRAAGDDSDESSTTNSLW